MPEIPVIPEQSGQCPAPSVTVNNLTSVYAFGSYQLSVDDSETAGRVEIDLSLLDEDDLPPIGTVMAMRVWLVDGDLDPLNSPSDTFLVTSDPPSGLPSSALFDLALIDGAGAMVIENEGQSKTWHVMAQINSLVRKIGTYTVGAS